VIAQQLLYFAGNGNFLSGWVCTCNFKGVVNLRQLARSEFDVYNGTDDLRDVANVCLFCGGDHARALLCNSAMVIQYFRLESIQRPQSGSDKHHQQESPDGFTGKLA
jgi:hypothetical protein